MVLLCGWQSVVNNGLIIQYGYTPAKVSTNLPITFTKLYTGVAIVQDNDWHNYTCNFYKQTLSTFMLLAQNTWGCGWLTIGY